tara:strand:- start:130 stop:312 length:183 start_codon:yes stop_codon:yes gene_type:complete
MADINIHRITEKPEFTTTVYDHFVCTSIDIKTEAGTETIKLFSDGTDPYITSINGKKIGE